MYKIKPVSKRVTGSLGVPNRACILIAPWTKTLTVSVHIAVTS